MVVASVILLSSCGGGRQPTNTQSRRDFSPAEDASVGRPPVGPRDGGEKVHSQEYGGLTSPAQQSGAPDVLLGGKDTPETDLIQQRLQRT